MRDGVEAKSTYIDILGLEERRVGNYGHGGNAVKGKIKDIAT